MPIHSGKYLTVEIKHIIFGAILSAMGAVLWQIAGTAFTIRDAVLEHSLTLGRIETSVTRQWTIINQHETRLGIIEAGRNGPERAR